MTFTLGGDYRTSWCRWLHLFHKDIHDRAFAIHFCRAVGWTVTCHAALIRSASTISANINSTVPARLQPCTCFVSNVSKSKRPRRAQEPRIGSRFQVSGNEQRDLVSKLVPTSSLRASLMRVSLSRLGI